MDLGVRIPAVIIFHHLFRCPMYRAAPKKISLILILIFILASGCATTMRPIPIDATSVKNNLRTGDEVRVTTKEGQVLELKVREVTGDKIVGEKEKKEVPFSNIEKIERREIDWKKTNDIVGFTYFMAALILLAIGPTVL